MNNNFFVRNEDSILRAQHPLYDTFCRDDREYNLDDPDDFPVEYDPMEEAESQWEMMNDR